jgi:hypothetical protein
MAGSTDRRVLLGRLAATPLRLRRLAGEGLTPELAARAEPGSWSPAEVLFHLAETDRDYFVPRLRRILAEETPALAPVTATGAGATALDPDVLLDVFAQARAHGLALLEGLDDAGWCREGIHPTRGRVSIEAYARYMADHDREHLGQLNQLRVARGLRPLRCEAGDPLPLAEIVAATRETPGRLEALIAGLDAAVLVSRPEPEAWAMKEVLAHLAFVEQALFVPRVRRMLDEDWPRFERFDPDAWARERDHRLGDARRDIAAFAGARAELHALVQGLGPAALERVGVNQAFGAVTVQEYLTHIAEHDVEHLDELERLRRAVLAR